MQPISVSLLKPESSSNPEQNLPKARNSPAPTEKKPLPKLAERQTVREPPKEAEKRHHPAKAPIQAAQPTQHASATNLAGGVEDSIPSKISTPIQIVRESESTPGRPAANTTLIPRTIDLHSREKTISLGTNDPVYAKYTKIIENMIGAHWEYPDIAKLYGLRGRVVVEFIILANGRVQFIDLKTSSGSNLLDEEAMRAIRVAAPFQPLPRAYNVTQLRIRAGFEYIDGRFTVVSNP